jgi:hypothetical protein
LIRLPETCGRAWWHGRETGHNSMFKSLRRETWEALHK